MKIKRAIAVGLVLGLLVVAIALLAGCAKNAVSVQPTSNGNVQLELLFEHNGCKVYRFEDFGRPVYYTDCRPASQTSMAWEQTAGKVTESVQSTTVTK